MAGNLGWGEPGLGGAWAGRSLQACYSREGGPGLALAPWISVPASQALPASIATTCNYLSLLYTPVLSYSGLTCPVLSCPTLA